MATNVNITEPPEFLRNYYAALAERGMNLGNLGFQSYQGNRVAPWNAQQDMAAQLIQQRAVNGSPLNAQGQNWLSNLLNGGMNVANTAAPSVIGNVAAAKGPSSIESGGKIGNVASPGQIGSVAAKLGPTSIASGGTATAGRNAYLGANNPYLSRAIDSAMGDVSAKINSQFKNNAFGTTAHQQTLAKELGDVANNMRMQDYTQQMGLSESDVNRQWQNQQYNINNANQLNQANANLGFQNANIQNQMGQFNAGLQGQNVANQMAVNSQNANIQGQNVANQNALNQFNANLGFQNAAIQNQMGQFNAGLQGQNVANQMANNQFNAGLQNQNYARQMTGLGLVPGMAGADYQDFNALMNVGNQLQGYNQNIANANYQEFMRQQDYPSQQLSWMQAGLNPAANAFRNSSTTSSDPQSNPWATAIGGALGGTSLVNMWNQANPGSSINPMWGGLGGLIGLLGG